MTRKPSQFTAPIQFTAPMVHAIHDGRKTMTRRILSPQPTENPGMGCTRLTFFDRKGQPRGNVAVENGDLFAPYYVDDRLWVKEAVIAVGGMVQYVADHKRTDFVTTTQLAWPAHWKSSQQPARFMPKAFSRITLVVMGVKVERLQDISEADAIAEGIESIPDNFGNGPAYCDYAMGNLADTAEWYSKPILSFRSLWRSIHGAEAWAENPWVAAISFETHLCNIDSLEK